MCRCPENPLENITHITRKPGFSTCKGNNQVSRNMSVYLSLSRGFLPSESKWRLGCALPRFTLLSATLCKVSLVTVCLTSSAVPLRPTTLIHEFQFFPKFFQLFAHGRKPLFCYFLVSFFKKCKNRPFRGQAFHNPGGSQGGGRGSPRGQVTGG